MSDSSSRNNGDASSAPRLTPKGRISKAKKGIRNFHVCADCGKTYSRAEHLRRHTQSHDDTKLKCSWPKCWKVFSRSDLLRRHEQKHAESRQLSSSGSSSTTHSGSGRKPSIAITAATPLISDHGMSFGLRDDALPLPLAGDASLLGNISQHNDLTTLPELKAEFDHNAVASTFSHLAPIPAQAAVIPYTDLSDPWTQFCSQDFQSLYAPLTTVQFSNPWTESSPASISSATTPLYTTWLIPVVQSSTHSAASSPLLLPSMSSANLSLDMPALNPLELTWSTLQTATQNLTLEPSFQEHTLSQHISQDTRQAYIAAYWTKFDSLYPVIHRQFLAAHAQNPLLEAAVLAVGAQYSDAPFAKSDSRLLYERCRDVIKKHTPAFALSCSLSNMQAIYLTEFLGIFRARRITKQLSEAFVNVVQQLWHQHNAYHAKPLTRSHLDLMVRPPEPSLSDTEHQQRWDEWLLIHSYQRLHAACHILQASEALMLPRPMSNQPELDVGFTLWLPTPFELWSANNTNDWLDALHSHPGLTTIDVCHSLDDIAAGISPTSYDEFQSSVVLAVYASSLANSANEYASHATDLHTVFSAGSYPLLRDSLSQSSYSQTQLEAIRLVANAPLKTLLAVSGESWLLGQRLAPSAQEGSQILNVHKGQLRSWANTLHPNFAIASLLDDMAGSSTNSVVLSSAHQSLASAKRILCLALESADAICFGPELAIYYATLLLWALTYANLPSLEQANSDESYDAPDKADVSDYRKFLEGSEPPMLTQSAVMPSTSWRSFVYTAISQAVRQLGGDDAVKERTSSGELVDSAIGVLKRLRKRGWVDGWF